MLLINTRLNEITPKTKTILVGVYGTLKRGFPAHKLLEQYEHFKFIGSYTLPNFQMHHLGKFPGIAPSSPTGDNNRTNDSIELEVYQISTTALPKLDAYEETPSLYKRYSGEANGKTIYFYVLNNTSNKPLINGWDRGKVINKT